MIKFYAEVLPTTLGRVIYRINKYLRIYSPEWAEFVSSPKDADFQILDVIGKGSLEFINNNNLIFLQHCFLTSEDSSPNYWHPVLQRAKLVVSYMDLNRLLENRQINFLRVPWGVDPNCFFTSENVEKNFEIISTGYISSTESIEEAYKAVHRIGKSMINIGKNFSFGPGFSCKENISDEEFRRLYERSKYVIGLRKIEGFELPIIEGLLCGARGICYNADHYKHWFGNLVEYIDEDPMSSYGVSYSGLVEEQIYNIITGQYRSVTQEEKELVKSKFSWKVIMKKIWERIKEVC